MTSKATTASQQSNPSKPANQPDVAALVARITELAEETLQHPQVVNKTDQGVASRVAKFLNKEGIHCAAHRFWTGAHVLAYVAKNGK